EVEEAAAERRLERSRVELESQRKRVHRLADLLEGARPLQNTVAAAERERADHEEMIREIRTLREHKNFDDLRVTDPANASRGRADGERWIPLVVFAAPPTLLLPGVVAYTRVRTRPGRRGGGKPSPQR